MSEEPEKLAEGTLISHLLELRDRLLRALVAVGIAFVPCVYYSNDLFTFVAQPLLAKLPHGSNLIATGVMSPFTTPFKLSFFAALLLAIPYVIYQLWSFVAPGLYRNERRFAVPLLVSSIVLFYVGVAFAYYFAWSFYPFGEWVGKHFLQDAPGGTQLLGFISAAILGGCVLIVVFYKEYIKEDTKAAAAAGAPGAGGMGGMY